MVRKQAPNLVDREARLPRQEPRIWRQSHSPLPTLIVSLGVLRFFLRRSLSVRRAHGPYSNASTGATQRNPVSSSHIVSDASLNVDGVQRSNGVVQEPPLSSWRPGLDSV